MDIYSSVNPTDSEPARVELYTEIEEVKFKREPPPPYSAEVVTNQPSVQQNVVLQAPLKSSKPSFYYCHNCRKRVLTKVEYYNSRKTHLFAGFICGFTFWCLLCCLAAIPYMITTCKKAHHYCPNCETFLGAHSKV